jgi:2-haloacid dehalogenase
MTLSGSRPIWLTFDCYGTLIQWDEGLMAAVERILARKGAKVDAARFLAVYDRHEHELEQGRPHRSFKEVSAASLERTMAELHLPHDTADGDLLTASISRMPPFPEVVATLGQLSAAGFKLAIISNTDDAIIAGNVAQLNGHIDKVITAQQAQAYKPSRQIFEHAWQTIGMTKDQIVHICASPLLDLTAAQALKFRAVWIDRGTGRLPPPGYAPDATAPRLDAVPKLFAAAGWL